MQKRIFTLAPQMWSRRSLQRQQKLQKMAALHRARREHEIHLEREEIVEQLWLEQRRRAEVGVHQEQVSLSRCRWDRASLARMDDS